MKAMTDLDLTPNMSPNTVQVHRHLRRSALTYAELYHIRVVGPRHERAHEQHGDPVHYSLTLPLGAARARWRHVSAPLADPNMPKQKRRALSIRQDSGCS